MSFNSYQSRIAKILKRAYFYFRRGYNLASLPIAFAAYMSSIYYLAINNVPYLNEIFPRFSQFLLIAGSSLIVVCGFIGYIYMKRSWFFREEMAINVESNPYATTKVRPNLLPTYKLWREIAKKEGLSDIVKELDEIIMNSERDRMVK